MPESISYAATVTDWEELLTAIEQNNPDLPQLEIPRQKLQMMLTQIRSAAAEQAALTASRQQATRRVYTLLADGRKLCSLLRGAVREHYGNRSEKLVEFGLQPLRPRQRAAAGDNPVPESA